MPESNALAYSAVLAVLATIRLERIFLPETNALAYSAKSLKAFVRWVHGKLDLIYSMRKFFDGREVSIFIE